MGFTTIIAWLVVGAIAGYIAGFLVKGDEGLGVIGHVVLGIVGALIGGFLWALLFEDEVNFDWNIGSFIVAVVGSLVLLAIVGFVRRRA